MTYCFETRDTKTAVKEMGYFTNTKIGNFVLKLYAAKSAVGFRRRLLDIPTR